MAAVEGADSRSPAGPRGPLWPWDGHQAAPASPWGQPEESPSPRWAWPAPPRAALRGRRARCGSAPSRGARARLLACSSAAGTLHPAWKPSKRPEALGPGSLAGRSCARSGAAEGRPRPPGELGPPSAFAASKAPCGPQTRCWLPPGGREGQLPRAGRRGGPRAPVAEGPGRSSAAASTYLVTSFASDPPNPPAPPRAWLSAAPSLPQPGRLGRGEGRHPQHRTESGAPAPPLAPRLLTTGGPASPRPGCGAQSDPKGVRPGGGRGARGRRLRAPGDPRAGLGGEGARAQSSGRRRRGRGSSSERRGASGGLGRGEGGQCQAAGPAVEGRRVPWGVAGGGATEAAARWGSGGSWEDERPAGLSRPDSGAPPTPSRGAQPHPHALREFRERDWPSPTQAASPLAKKWRVSLSGMIGGHVGPAPEPGSAPAPACDWLAPARSSLQAGPGGAEEASGGGGDGGGGARAGELRGGPGPALGPGGSSRRAAGRGLRGEAAGGGGAGDRRNGPPGFQRPPPPARSPRARPLRGRLGPGSPHLGPAPPARPCVRPPWARRACSPVGCARCTCGGAWPLRPLPSVRAPAGGRADPGTPGDPSRIPGDASRSLAPPVSTLSSVRRAPVAP
ncbi:collagen alpha-1(I) chain-like [Choloepus didactylus]|uniref:collagen alpha-1(I) chain-like n=1 Tax=Choloepus didactylus TaxID=27675 RepID=UPI00189D7F39|nr:collagen alpha-1(I) chain-like [Choloepus didactylus]